MSDEQNRMTVKQESDLLIKSMISNRIGQHDIQTYRKLIETMTKFEKKTSH